MVAVRFAHCIGVSYWNGFVAHCILRPPYKQIRNADEDLQRRIAVYITQVVGGHVADMACRLPTPSYFAGKFHIRNGGDTFRTQEACQRSGTLARRNCYVRVC